MPINPDTYDQLHALYKRFDTFPEEARAPGGGVVLRKDAWLAFLEARGLILSLANDVHAMSRGWQAIETFFEAEHDGPNVLLWAMLPETGEFAVTLGWWDDDSRLWFRECEGPDCEALPLAPTKWMALGELTGAAGEASR